MMLVALPSVYLLPWFHMHDVYVARFIVEGTKRVRVCVCMCAFECFELSHLFGIVGY